MMSREIPFEPDERCDCCGALGAFDFMGDFLCPNCVIITYGPLDDDKTQGDE